MNQIILDIEWYDSEEIEGKIRNILQIGAIKINDIGEVIDDYYSIICPETISSIPDEIYEFMHISRKDIIESKPLKDVLKEFQAWCGFNSYSVVLSMNSVSVLKDAYLKAELKYPFVGSITIQELYSSYYKLGENCNFGKMCYNLDIEVDENKLHLSNYDTILCMQLYLKIRALIIEAINKGVVYDKLYAVSNETRRVLHLINCSSISENLNNYYIISLMDIDEKKFIICKECIVYDVRSLTIRKYKLKDNPIWYKPIKPWFFINIEKIKTMCDKVNYKFYVNGGEIFIDTGISWWRFNPYRKIIKIYHSNNVCDFSPYGDDYHLQARSFPDPYQAVMYIIVHDTKKYEKLKRTRRC